MTEQERLDALRREMTAGLWWIDFLAFWGNLARALELKSAIDKYTGEWNTLRRACGTKGRPKGAPNKPKRASVPTPSDPVQDIVDTL